MAHEDIIPDRNQTQLANLLQSVEEDWTSHTFSDVAVRVGGVKFECHKLILNSTPYFKCLLRSNMKECQGNIIDLKGITISAFELIIRFLYTQKVVINKENVFDLLEASDMLQIDALIQPCIKFLRWNLNEENCLGAWLLAQKLGKADLEKPALNTAVKFFPEICHSSDFLELSAADLTKYLRSDKLKATNEEEVLDAVVKWLEYKRVERKPCTVQVLQYIRLTQIDSFTLQGILQRVEVLNSNKKCCELISGILENNPQQTQQLYSGYPRLSFGEARHLFILGLGEVTARANGYMYPIQGSDEYTSATPVKIRKNISSETLPNESYETCMINNDVYLSYSGKNGGVILHRYCVSQDTWMKCTSLEEDRIDYQIIEYGHNICIVGGSNVSDKSTCYSSIMQYSPTKDKWTIIGNLKKKVAGMGVGKYKGCIVTFGGRVQGTGPAADNLCNHVQMVDIFQKHEKSCQLLAPLPERMMCRAVVHKAHAFLFTDHQGADGKLNVYDMDKETVVISQSLSVGCSIDHVLLDDHYIYISGEPKCKVTNEAPRSGSGGQRTEPERRIYLQRNITHAYAICWLPVGDILAYTDSLVWKSWNFCGNMTRLHVVAAVTKKVK